MSARLLLDARSSRRARLTTRAGASAVLGRGSDLRTRAASFRVTVELTPRALRALKRLRRARLTLSMRATGGTRSATSVRSIAYLR